MADRLSSPPAQRPHLPLSGPPARNRDHRGVVMLR